MRPRLTVVACTFTALAVSACGDDAVDPTPVSASGTAFAFTLPGTPYGRIAGAVSVLERPEVETTSDDEGVFTVDGLRPGDEATFVIVADGFPEAQTKTFLVPDEGLELLTFQVPANQLYDLLAQSIEVELDPTRCQVVSTVTRVGKSIYDPGAHGEAGATVTIEPELPAEHGPIYFNDDVIPDRARTESSTDGGVVFTNVPPGRYTLRAHKDGVTFESVTVECRPNVLVNASPPYGLQALAE